MKTASQIIRRLLESPDLNLDEMEAESQAACDEARAFLAMEQEVQEVRALVKLSKFDEAGTQIYGLINKYGLSEAILELAQFRSRVKEAHRTLKLQALLKEALELASQDDADFDRDGRGQQRVVEIAKEAAQL